MDVMRTLADYSIRRALGFAGFGVLTLMLALSFDMGLALRTGGELLALICLGLIWCAWRAPRRNMRRSELGILVAEHAPARLRGLSASEAQRMMAEALRQRLLWHAEQVGFTALALWLAALVLRLVIG
ncbi:hypothetical protein ACVFYP_03005 [Roseomonas sp. F4]